MSKSLEFCKKTALNPERSSYYELNPEKFHEFNTIDFLKYHAKGNFQLDKQYQLGDYNIIVNYDADTNFDYFTSDSCICDGTIWFVIELMAKCLNKVINLQTYYSSLGTPPIGATVNITIGNFVIANDINRKYATEEKPYLTDKEVVMLPIKMWYSHNGLEAKP